MENQTYNFYFTFGTAKHFPFSQNEYVKITASSEQKAVELFRNNYPDYHTDTINCAFYYSEEEWLPIYEKYYKDREPSVILNEDMEEKYNELEQD